MPEPDDAPELEPLDDSELTDEDRTDLDKLLEDDTEDRNDGTPVETVDSSTDVRGEPDPGDVRFQNDPTNAAIDAAAEAEDENVPSLEEQHAEIARQHAELAKSGNINPEPDEPAGARYDLTVDGNNVFSSNDKDAIGLRIEELGENWQQIIITRTGG
jgi:hypothetical protein